MPFTFVHLSDIHFGQEKRKGELIVQDDVKAQLIADAAKMVKVHADEHACGIIVTGDIAYGGKRDEYVVAAHWLDRLAAAIGCEKTSVHVVPGNHDIDRDAISSGCQLMINDILEHGEKKLDAYLEAERDREVLFERFINYRPFAEGYDCPLDSAGGYASDKSIEVGPGRTLRFIGLNSALICSSASASDEEGRLLLGERQHVLPREPGVELVVLGHHPLHWLRDSESARNFVRSRARVFVSGHEHNPSLNIEEINDGSHLLTLAAGATVPPNAGGGFTYTYNLLTFDWDEGSDGLSVKIYPRVWSTKDTMFENDPARLGTHQPECVLGCPNFRAAPKGEVTSSTNVEQSDASDLVEETVDVVLSASGSIPMDPSEDRGVPDRFPLLLLRFFRDLSPAQRVSVLVGLNELPSSWTDSLTHTIERKVINGLAAKGRLDELEKAIDAIEKDHNENGERDT